MDKRGGERPSISNSLNRTLGEAVVARLNPAMAVEDLWKPLAAPIAGYAPFLSLWRMNFRVRRRHIPLLGQSGIAEL